MALRIPPVGRVTVSLLRSILSFCGQRPLLSVISNAPRIIFLRAWHAPCPPVTLNDVLTKASELNKSQLYVNTVMTPSHARPHRGILLLRFGFATAACGDRR